MLPNEGLHEDIGELGSEVSEHAPGLASGSPQSTITPAGGGAGGRDNNLESGQAPNVTSSSPTHDETLSDPSGTSELDPHICKQWPCPQCHKPRDYQDEIPKEQYSSEAASLRPSSATATQSFFHPQAASEPLRVEQSESDDDLLLDIVATSAHGQNQEGHCS